jgi:cytochrome c556
VRTPVSVVASVVVLAATVAIRAQQAPPATLVPVTAASLVAQTDRYVGQVVAVYGTVDTTLTSTTFSMDQDPKKPSMNDVLVIAPNLNSHAKPGEYVTVVGEVMRFDPATLATKAPRYKLNLPPGGEMRYAGKVMVLATSVVDGTMTELAKFVPPPITPEEAAFDAVMKQVNPTLGEMRKGVEASDAAIVKAQGTKLRDLFAETRTFFAKRSVADAQGWAGDAVSLVEAVTKGAASNDWAAAKDAASKIQPLCAQCHNAHRERLEDGTYRVKGLWQ